MSKSIKGFLALALVSFLCLLVTACDGLRDKAFGAAETSDLRAYRAHLIYEGLASLVQPSEQFRNADMSARSAIRALHDRSGDEYAFNQALDQTQHALRLYAVAVAGEAGIDITGLDLKAAVIKIALKSPKVAKEALRVRQKMNELDAAARSPTAEEWQTLIDQVDRLHLTMQGSLK